MGNLDFPMMARNCLILMVAHNFDGSFVLFNSTAQDPHVLDIRQGEVLAIKADAGKANPTIALQFMCQQINCVRNK